MWVCCEQPARIGPVVVRSSLPSTVFRATEVEGDYVAETILRVLEGNDQTRVFRVQYEQTGALVDYDLTDATEIKLIVKKGRTTPDSEATFVYSTADDPAQVVVGDPPTWGLVEIRLKSTDLVASHWWYRLDVTKGEAVRTVMMGPFIVEHA